MTGLARLALSDMMGSAGAAAREETRGSMPGRHLLWTAIETGGSAPLHPFACG